MLDEFIKLCKKEVPSLKIVPKQDSALMRFLNKVLFFVPNFMTRYTTTLGSTIYATEGIMKAIDDGNPRIVGLLAHEVMHLTDKRDMGGVWFSFLYIFPQVLSLWSLFALIAIWEGPQYLWFLLALLFLLPLPAPGRARIEKRGYLLSLMHHRFVYGDKPVPAWVLENFTGPAYYFMWPFPVSLEKWFNDSYEDIKNDKFDHQWVDKVKRFLQEYDDERRAQ